MPSQLRIMAHGSSTGTKRSHSLSSSSATSLPPLSPTANRSRCRFFLVKLFSCRLFDATIVVDLHLFSSPPVVKNKWGVNWWLSIHIQCCILSCCCQPFTERYPNAVSWSLLVWDAAACVATLVFLCNWNIKWYQRVMCGYKAALATYYL